MARLVSDILCKMGNKRGDIQVNILGIILITFGLLITIYTLISVYPYEGINRSLSKLLTLILEFLSETGTGGLGIALTLFGIVMIFFS
jgi:hypothetical protein